MARAAALTAVATAVVLGVAACGGGDRSAGREDAPAEVVGVITEIERSGGMVTAITVRSDGTSHRVAVDPAIDYGFDLEHLEEHRATGDPVRCTLARRGAELVATAIADV